MRWGTLKQLLPRAAVVAAVLGAMAVVLNSDDGAAWLGVGRVKPAFADVAVITAGWECSRKGYDVLAENPCDRFGPRPMNYPRAWLAARPLGLDQRATRAFGLAIGALFIMALWFLVGAPPWRGTLVWIALACSPPVLLGLERGNIDNLMFALITLALWLAGRLAPVRAALVIGLAAVLKLYPIVAAVILLRRSRRFLVAGGALALAFALYLFVIRDDIELLQKATPKIVWNSFGIGVLTDGLASGQFGVIDPVAGFAPGQTLRSVVTLGVPIAVAIVGLVLAQRLPPLSRDERDWRADGLLVAAGLSVATYIFGHNFDYRLVFVLLAVPQLLAWTRSPGSWAWLARAALVAMGLTLWTGTAEGTARWGYELLGQSPKSAPGMFFPLDELTNIAMQALLAAGAFAILRQRLVARRPPVPSAAAPVPA